jgi:hypothetical protein
MRHTISAVVVVSAVVFTAGSQTVGQTDMPAGVAPVIKAR